MRSGGNSNLFCAFGDGQPVIEIVDNRADRQASVPQDRSATLHNRLDFDKRAVRPRTLLRPDAERSTAAYQLLRILSAWLLTLTHENQPVHVEIEYSLTLAAFSSQRAIPACGGECAAPISAGTRPESTRPIRRCKSIA